MGQTVRECHVGDQFGPTNERLLPRVFSWLYFSINAGSAISTLLIPWLRNPFKASPVLAARLPGWLVSFLEKCHGPAIAFGTPGVFMVLATLIFWLGRRKFVHIPPVGLSKYIAELSQTGNLKALLNLLIPVPFVAMFWALWQQNFSSWVLQAGKMDRHLFGIEWLPSQIQTVNPVFILILLPLFWYVVYPAINRVFRLTPLRKIGIGLFVTAGAFLIVALIQVRIDAGGRPNILWQILAFVVLTMAEVMVSVTHLEFAYTQAPRKMKSLVMCTYLGAVALGNLFTARVNFFIQNPDGTVKLTGALVLFLFHGRDGCHVGPVCHRGGILPGTSLYPTRGGVTQAASPAPRNAGRRPAAQQAGRPALQRSGLACRVAGGLACT